MKICIKPELEKTCKRKLEYEISESKTYTETFRNCHKYVKVMFISINIHIIILKRIWLNL